MNMAVAREVDFPADKIVARVSKFCLPRYQDRILTFSREDSKRAVLNDRSVVPFAFRRRSVCRSMPPVPFEFAAIQSGLILGL